MFNFKEFTEHSLFTKFLGLYFGRGVTYSYIETYLPKYGNMPVSQILVIHVPYLKEEEAYEKLVEFSEVVKGADGYPQDCVIDIDFITKEDFDSLDSIEDIEYDSPGLIFKSDEDE